MLKSSISELAFFNMPNCSKSSLQSKGAREGGGGWENQNETCGNSTIGKCTAHLPKLQPPKEARSTVQICEVSKSVLGPRPILLGLQHCSSGLHCLLELLLPSSASEMRLRDLKLSSANQPTGGPEIQGVRVTILGKKYIHLGPERCDRYAPVLVAPTTKHTYSFYLNDMTYKNCFPCF